MRRVGSRVDRLERRVASRPRPECPDCSTEGGGIRFVVLPPRVIGVDDHLPPPEPPPPERCGRCGRTREHEVFVVRPPRPIGGGQEDGA